MLANQSPLYQSSLQNEILYRATVSSHFADTSSYGCGCLSCQKLKADHLEGKQLQAADKAQLDSSAPISGVLAVDALIADYGASRWNANQSFGTGVTVTYSFMGATPSYYDRASYGEYYNFRGFTEGLANAARAIFQQYQAVANITFQEVSDAGNGGQIRLGMFGGRANDNSIGEAFNPSTHPIGGDVWIRADSQANFDAAPGKQGYYVLLHEIGHALGFKHPGSYGRGDEGPYLPSSLDHTTNTVMSYNGNVKNINLAPFDVQAIQWLYGPKEAKTIGRMASGANGDDNIRGSDADNILIGGGGNDIIAGGTGTDIALYKGAKSQYTFGLKNGEILINDSTGAEGFDRLASVEKFQFADGTYTATQLVGNVAATTDIIYRFFNTKTTAHFYTASSEERDYVVSQFEDFSYESAVFGVAQPGEAGSSAVFRFFNKATGTHFLTINPLERDNVIANLPQFQYEGITYHAYEASTAQGNTSLFRFYNEATGTHFYTINAAERDNIINTLPHYHYEGTAYFVEGI